MAGAAEQKDPLKQGSSLLKHSVQLANYFEKKYNDKCVPLSQPHYLN